MEDWWWDLLKKMEQGILEKKGIREREGESRMRGERAWGVL
jgi:hypothetical protein